MLGLPPHSAQALDFDTAICLRGLNAEAEAWKDGGNKTAPAPSTNPPSRTF